MKSAVTKGKSTTMRLSRALGRLSLAVLAVLCICMGTEARAQFDIGTITGTITDSSGAALANAAVTVTNTNTDMQTKVKADSNGAFVASALQFGRYVVSASAAGFTTANSAPLQLTVGATANVKLVLTV